MQLRYFTLAISALIVLAHNERAVGQPAPSPTPPKTGYVRFWNMLPEANGNFQLILADKLGDPPLATASAYSYSSYVGYPAGKYKLAVVKQESTTPLKVFDVDLKPESFYTVMVAPQKAELINDTEDPVQTSGTLTIRNFFPGSLVTALIDGKQVGNAFAYGQTFEATGLPLQPAQVAFRAQLPNGQAAESIAEMDFKFAKQASALIIPDVYGRFRPRLTPDGKNP